MAAPEIEGTQFYTTIESSFEDYEGQRVALMARSAALREQVERCHYDASLLCRWTNTASMRNVLDNRAALIARNICALSKEIMALRQRVEKEYREDSPTLSHINALCKHLQRRSFEFQTLWQELIRVKERAGANQVCSVALSATSSFRLGWRPQNPPSETFSPERVLRVRNPDQNESAQVTSDDESERGRSIQRRDSSSPEKEKTFQYKGRDVEAIRERIRWEMAEEYNPDQRIRFKEHSTYDHFEYIDEARKANRSPIPPSIEAPANMHWVYYVWIRDRANKKK